jgi:dipeptidase E
MKGQSYLGWPQEYLKKFLQGVKTVVFIPYAGVTVTYDEYTQSVSNALSEFGLEIIGAHTIAHKKEEILKADCVMVGGGNTFSLLKKLHEEGLTETIHSAVSKGAKYVGWSAGANMACPTIKTTNDMPIEQPQSFNAIGLITYQINPHFTNATIPNHGGESREMRIEEYLVKNPNSTVIGLPEGMLIEVNGENSYLKGEGEALLFKQGEDASKFKTGDLVI